MKYKEDYIAGIFEGRGAISLKPFYVCLRMKGPIPKWCHKQWGGTYYNLLGKPFFRVVGKSAFRLLQDLEPYLVLEKRKVARFLKRPKNKDF